MEKFKNFNSFFLKKISKIFFILKCSRNTKNSREMSNFTIRNCTTKANFTIRNCTTKGGFPLYILKNHTKDLIYTSSKHLVKVKQKICLILTRIIAIN